MKNSPAYKATEALKALSDFNQAAENCEQLENARSIIEKQQRRINELKASEKAYHDLANEAGELIKARAKHVRELEAALDVALESLETITKQFTRVPSSLKDSEARGVAHAAMKKLKETRK